MHVKKLSPLDLCEVFSYGDARKHPLVPLSHVCEVLFDLDPESANGQDPVTQEMEEFLYQFATDEEGKLMVNIREALRALDIWQSRVTSSLPVSPSKFSSDPQSKAVILEAKNKKLKDVISSLQDANFRLSRELDTAKLALSPKSQKESPTRALPKQSSVEVSVSRDSSSNKLQIVNLHEQELIDMANKLQFTGVKKLERFLVEDDTESTGFISLKQLCWILADQFELKVSKIRLIEVCMGMKFNSNAQLDYQEFVDVLMDILIYALPDIRESAKRKSLVQFDQYLQSGFPPGRENIRQLLDTLCSKYDGRGDQCISVSDMVRVFHVDLVKHHALELPFPLLQSDTVQLAQPFVQHKLHDRLSEGFLSYTEMLDAILGPYPSDLNREAYDSDEDDLNLRYDVLLKLTFGFPELCDQRFFEKFIQKKLLCEQRRIQSYLKDLSARGDSNKFAIHDFHGLFIAQAEQFPLTIIEMLYLFGTLDANREGSIELKTLKTHLSAICWSNDKQNDRDETSTNVGESTNVDEVKQLISKCCSGYDFQRPLKDMSRHTQGWISQTVMVKELEKMLYEMGVVGVQQDDLKDLVRHISQHSTGNTPRASTRDSIHTDGFFDALFDWNAIIKHMRLPDSLVEMKKIFAIFDSKYTDTIQCEDWNKAYRQICRDHHGMSEWEIQVLQRRFPGHTKQREQKRTIDYGHLIVFLLDYQQRQARKLLQLRVVEHFQQIAIDTTNKGYFDVTDLKRYLTTEFSRESEQGLYSDSIVLLNNNDALESVMWILAGETLDHSRGQSEQGAKPLSRRQS
ncbi:hypothetical protein PHMEG_0007406 [Phytophthora megakarya]|uniref:Uncharacterized protein n=1 Tax=Phytophthora megakarya TaxID=4795 RepID=A0A225WLA6_9STRA|nr:hypothetical protein PHMEG_0007406 [Phytophthora megakarya]